MSASQAVVQAGDSLQIKVDWTIASELAWNGMNATYQARFAVLNADFFRKP